jgi:hypothetical protein
LEFHRDYVTIGLPVRANEELYNRGSQPLVITVGKEHLSVNVSAKVFGTKYSKLFGPGSILRLNTNIDSKSQESAVVGEGDRKEQKEARGEVTGAVEQDKGRTYSM